MKAGDPEIGTREKTKVIPQAVQEANALRDRRQAAQEAATSEDDGAPAKSAKKEEWEAYAASLDIETEGLTKDQIIEAVEAAS